MVGLHSTWLYFAAPLVACSAEESNLYCVEDGDQDLQMYSVVDDDLLMMSLQGSFVGVNWTQLQDLKLSSQYKVQLHSTLH